MIFKILDKLSARHKLAVAIYYDILIALISLPLAILLRLEGFTYFTDSHFLVTILAIAFVAKISANICFRVHRGIWRFASINDLVQIIKTATLSSGALLFIGFIATRLESVPRSLFVIDWFLTILLMSLGRFSFRVWKERSGAARGIRTLIIGGGRSGEQLIREIKRDTRAGIKILGVLDDAPTKRHRTIHGISVLGPISDLSHHVKELNISQIIVAIPSAPAKTIGKILKESSMLELKTMILPGIDHLVDGKISISELRPINIEDLLGREPIKLDQSSLVSMLNDKVILVTGAGGSIGSELCRQILKFGPRRLLLLDSCEFFLYKLHLDLSESLPNIEIIPLIADVRDRSRLDKLFFEYEPQIIFHAAAYKHVPMMERHPGEAIATNVFGTRNVAELAVKHSTEKFILVSTDKAVNPTNVMGTTKRIAELVCQSIAHASHHQTKFAMVRFGNVLGSSGSVVPRFLDQIKAGGPVTVTHPEITRYFMSIPEAAQLVIQAGAISKGGEIFVLDMGEPIKIVHLAKGMIRLSGADESRIEIKFTGLRPGEKLYEELLADREQTLPTTHEKVRIAKAIVPDSNFLTQIGALLQSDDLRATLKELVPEYKSSES